MKIECDALLLRFELGLLPGFPSLFPFANTCQSNCQPDAGKFLTLPDILFHNYFAFYLWTEGRLLCYRLVVCVSHWA